MDITTPTTRDLRLIEAGFPCHQVGAETQREQSVGLQPPVNRLHVWWARRPLTPSRAALVGVVTVTTCSRAWNRCASPTACLNTTGLRGVRSLAYRILLIE